MTTGALERRQRAALLEHAANEVRQPGPTDQTEQQADHEAHVRASAYLSRGRIHDVTVLSVLVAVQLGWMAALVYGLWLLA
jgi:hypothetical protein